MSIELEMPSNHIILCCPLLLLPSIFPSIREWVSSSHQSNMGASASVLPVNIQDWFPLGSTGLISLLSKVLSRVLFGTLIWKTQFFSCSAFFMVQLSLLYMNPGKSRASTIQIFVGKVMSLLFNVNFHDSSVDKESAYNTGDLGSIPVLGRSPEEGNGNALQYSCLENPMDRGAWWATVQGVVKSQTQLSDKHL